MSSPVQSDHGKNNRRADGGGKADEGHGGPVFVCNVHLYRFVGYLELSEGKLNPNYTADLRRGVAVEYIPKSPA